MSMEVIIMGRYHNHHNLLELYPRMADPRTRIPGAAEEDGNKEIGLVAEDEELVDEDLEDEELVAEAGDPDPVPDRAKLIAFLAKRDWGANGTSTDSKDEPSRPGGVWRPAPADPFGRRSDIVGDEKEELLRIRRLRGSYAPCPNPDCGPDHYARREGGTWSCPACGETFLDIKGVPAAPMECPFCQAPHALVLRGGENDGRIWRCRTCGMELADGADGPVKPQPCPECSGGKLVLEHREGYDVWHCSNGECGLHLPDFNGRPRLHPTARDVGVCPRCSGEAHLLEPARPGPASWFCSRCGSMDLPGEESVQSTKPAAGKAGGRRTGR